MKKILVVICCCVIGSYSMYAEDDNQIEWSTDIISDSFLEDSLVTSGPLLSDDTLSAVSLSGSEYNAESEVIINPLSWTNDQSVLSGEFVWTLSSIDKEEQSNNISYQQIDDVSDNNDEIVLHTNNASIVSDTEQRTVVVDNDIVTIIWK